MTIRGRWADVFWFSFFHELGHLVLKHSKREIFLEDGQHDKRHQEEESDADAFARDTLIPPKEFKNFLDKGQLTPGSIAAFAKSVGVAPGIVVGRLQHDGQLGRNQHMYRVRYSWAENEPARPH